MEFIAQKTSADCHSLNYLILIFMTSQYIGYFVEKISSLGYTVMWRVELSFFLHFRLFVTCLTMLHLLKLDTITKGHKRSLTKYLQFQCLTLSLIIIQSCSTPNLEKQWISAFPQDQTRYTPSFEGMNVKWLEIVKHIK